MMARIMIQMASPTEVGADRIVRLAISSEFDRISGVYLAEDTVKPAHKEAQNASKRAHIKTIADKPLRAWL